MKKYASSFFALLLASICLSQQRDSSFRAADTTHLFSIGTITTDNIIIEATRARRYSPVAISELNSKDIAVMNNGQDMPQILRLTPSLISTSDAGNGIGYTGMWIRGSDPSRIHVSINGVPLNDPESQQVFWVNTADLASSASSIQIQRGIGTSSIGVGSFGGGIRIDTRSMESKPYVRSSILSGSFGSSRLNLQAGSGLINDHWTIEGRLSSVESEGYIERARTKLFSYFTETAYRDDHTFIKLTLFGGNEETYQSWYGTPAAAVYGDTRGIENYAERNGLTTNEIIRLVNEGRRYNYYTYENQVDKYRQHHGQLFVQSALADRWKSQTTLHYTRGLGYFEEFKAGDDLIRYGIDSLESLDGEFIYDADVVRRRWLDNHFYGVIQNVTGNWSHVQTTIGVAANIYDGLHYGEVVDVPTLPFDQQGLKYYRGIGQKLDFSGYWQTDYKFWRDLSLFLDLLLRRIHYTTRGMDNDRRQYDVQTQMMFFNPKGGLNWVSNDHRLYGSVSKAGKEPNRNDFVDAAIPSRVRPEYMIDYELGYEMQREIWGCGMNLYHMSYTDQLVLTGELNDVGAPLRTNVDKSFRQGAELKFNYLSQAGIFLMMNATLSRNLIQHFDEILYNYGEGPAIDTLQYYRTPISFSPMLSGGSSLGWSGALGKKKNEFTCALLSKYVGRQFLDNTGSKERSMPDYFITDINLKYKPNTGKRIQVTLQVWLQNITNKLYVSNGYTYSYLNKNRVSEVFLYPQATRNFMFGFTIEY
ncbi:MAG: TonB-dependent receptor [Flavobacteriales bacterium]